MDVLEVMENWDGNREFDEWWALDEYIKGRIIRLRVGPKDEVLRDAEMRVTGTNLVDGSGEPCEPGEFGLPEDQPFFRALLIGPEEAREFFEGCVERTVWIPQSEAAEILGVTRGRVSQLVKAGQLQAREDGMLDRREVEKRRSEARGAGRPRRG